MSARIQIPFSFNYPSGGNLVPAVNASIGVYVRNSDGSQGSPVAVYQSQSGNNQYASLQTDSGGNVPGWVNEGTYKIVATAIGGFGGGTINFDALYGGGTSVIALNAVDTPQLSTAVQASLIIPGLIFDYGGSTAPAGFLKCDGSVVTQASYPNLYGAIGTNWNIGGESGSSFRLPNLIGTMTLGSGTASWGTLRTLGKYGLPSGGTYLGEETHLLLSTESGLPDHQHFPYGGNGYYFLSSYGGAQYTGAGSGGLANYAAGTTGSVVSGAQSASLHHNTMPPFAVVNKIIKY